MQFAFSPTVLTLFLSTVVCLGLALYCLLRRTAPGAVALSATFLGAGWWAFAYALELAGVDLGTKLFWAHLKFIGLASTVPCWLVFTLCILDRAPLLRRLAPLVLVPLITIALALSGDRGGWLYRSATIETVSPFTLLTVTYGRWFGVHLAFNVVLMSVGGLLLWRELWRPAALIRRQAIVTLLAMVAPTLGSWNRFLPFGPWPGLDLAPFCFLLMGLLMFWAFYGERVLDLVPIARAAVIEGMHDAVLVLDPRGRLLDLNPAARQLLPQTAGLLGQPLDHLLPLPAHRAQPELTASASATFTLLVGGTERDFDFTRTPLVVHGALQGAIVSLRDVTERERAMAQIAHLAHHDALTGLLNRATFIARLDAALAAGGGRGCAILFLDLDGFKAVNDTYGHAVGDWLLVEAGARLRPCVPGGGLLARLGGDEFTVYLATDDPDAIAAVALEIQHVLGQPFLLGEQAISLAVSVGSAVGPDDGRDASALLHAADLAMYIAKGLGREDEPPPVDTRWSPYTSAFDRPTARGYAAPKSADARVTANDARTFALFPATEMGDRSARSQDE